MTLLPKKSRTLKFKHNLITKGSSRFVHSSRGWGGDKKHEHMKHETYIINFVQHVNVNQFIDLFCPDLLNIQWTKVGFQNKIRVYVCGVWRDDCVFPALLTTGSSQTACTSAALLHLTINTHHFCSSNFMFCSFKDLFTWKTLILCCLFFLSLMLFHDLFLPDALEECRDMWCGA